MDRNFEPKGIKFFDAASNREMILVAEPAHLKGWLCYRHPDGQWVSLRKATEEERTNLAQLASEGALGVPEWLKKIPIYNPFHPGR
jgi:hypothetical protein